MSALVITRRYGESFSLTIGGEVAVITVVGVGNDQARLRIVANAKVRILRDDAVNKAPLARDHGDSGRESR